MKRRSMRALFAALMMVVTPSLARVGVALASDSESATGFTVDPTTPDAIAGAELRTPAMLVLAPEAEADLSGTLLASRYEPSRRTRGDGPWAPPPPSDSRYRPRRERYREERPSSGWRARGVSQLHAGFLDPDGNAGPGFLLGFRGGTQIDEMIQIGLGVDWRHKSGRSTEVLQESVGPGGETIIVQRDLSSFSSNLLPGVAYLQLSGPSNLGVVPYFGVAGSWQILFLSGEDFQTGSNFEGTYDGFGWQMWGGASVPLSSRSRFVGELFLNDADLSRDVFDASSGTDVHETVSTNGLGARFGLLWGF